MYTEDLIVNYQGFKPSQRAFEGLKRVTEILFNESPSESSLKATFTRLGEDQYQGILKITSSVGSFIARAEDYDLVNVGNKLMSEVRRQLNGWKNLRFLQ